MRRYAPLSAFVVFLALTTPASADSLFESERLHISGDVPETWIDQAAELGRALFPALEQHFGRAPEAKRLPLRLVLYPRRAAYEQALRKQGITGHAKHAGGWTVWKTGVSHVWLQKEPFDTRRLILHELFHQFHDKCRAYARRASGAWWYREGLAEWFGWHRRTQQGIAFGALDAVALNDLARRAAARVQAEDFDPWAVATGRTKDSYVDALALVGGLMLAKDKDLRARFRHWERQVLWRGGEIAAFRKRFAERKEDLRSALRIGWGTLGGQWQPDRFGWDERKGVIAVRKGPRSTCMRVGWSAPRSFSTRVEVVTGTEPAAAAGIALPLHGDRPLFVFADRDQVWLTQLTFRQPADKRAATAALPQGRKTVLDVRVSGGVVEVFATRAGKRASLRLALGTRRVASRGFVVEGTGARFQPLPPGGK